MQGKDVSKLMDWNDTLRENSPIEPRLSHATTYGYKTRSNASLFKYGVTDVSSEESQDDAIRQVVGDSVDSRCVRLFIDYTTFSNPFMKFNPKRDKMIKSDLTEASIHRLGSGFNKIGAKGVLSVSSRSLANHLKPLFVSHNMLVGDSPVEAPPEEFKPINHTMAAGLAEKKNESSPIKRKIIKNGTYYMYEMFKAVNNETGLSDSLSKAFKNHVVQNHQNLHEVLTALKTEKPLATPLPVNLPAGLGNLR